MKEPAEDRHNGDTSSVLSDRIPFRAILAWLGCFLLLRGNALAWPCLPAAQSWPDCYPLTILFVSAAQLTIFLAIGILLIALAVNLLRSPLDLVYWLVLLLVPYWLFVARLRPEPVFGGRLPLVRVNQQLSGPSSVVMPMSLIVSWLALRPRSLRRKWRLLATVLLLVLLFLTAFFLVLMGNRPYQVTIPSFVEHAGILGTGPLLILAGGVLLLGAEYVGHARERTRAVTAEKVIGATTAKPKRANDVGFWSALFASPSSIMVVVTSLFGVSSGMQGYDVGTYYLTSGLRAGAILLLAICFVVLIASICHYAAAEKKTWTRVGLVSAIAYAVTYGVNAYLYSSIWRMSPQVYGRLATSLPILRRFGALGALSLPFASLALLLTLPVLRRGGLEQVIRWCIVGIGVLTVINGLGYLLSGVHVPALSVLAGAIAQSVLFPVAMALFATVFRCRESASVLPGAGTD
jgi:hypothetical protein